MGWSFVYSMEGRDTPKAYLDGVYTWSNDEADVRVLKSAVRGRVYYAAVERRSRKTGERIVFAGVCLFRRCSKSRDGTVFGYKSMDETVGPCERHCPAGILDLLTETRYPYAIQWRADCRSNLADQAQEQRQPRPKAGDIVLLAEPMRFTDGAELRRFKATHLPRRRNLVFQSLENGGFYRLPKLSTLAHQLNPKEEAREGQGGLQPKEKTMSDIDTPTNTSTVTVVPEDRRMDFLPRLLSPAWLLRGENAIYDFMTQLSSDYGGGLWTFLERDGQPLYMAPDTDKQFKISWWGNGFEGEVSADAAGIIACLFAFSHLSMRFGSEHLAEAFERLRDYVFEHPECAAILGATD